MKKVFIPIIIIVLMVLIRIIFGELNIKLKISFNNPTYKMMINEKETGIDLETRKTNTIIPLFLKLTSVVYNYSVNGDSTTKYDFGQRINLSIKSYYCYGKITGNESQTMCTNDNSKYTLKEIENVDYTRMKITGGLATGITNALIYDGEYISDITDLLEKKGYYQIFITSKYDNYESDILFTINLK